MRKQTAEKLNDILEMIEVGKTEKEIVEVKFGRNHKNFKKWVDKLQPELSEAQKETLNNLNGPNLNTPILSEILKRLEVLEAKATPIKQVSNTLQIEVEVLEMKSDVRSVRVNKELIKRFNEISGKNKQYSKVNLLNKALKDFIEKYQ